MRFDWNSGVIPISSRTQQSIQFDMATDNQALVLIDPMNDFIHPKGKLYPAIQDSLTKTNTVENLRKLAHSAREKGIPIYYGLHQQYKEGNYDGWKHAKQIHERTKQSQAFAGWGGEIMEGFEPQLSNGDVVVSRHWNSRFVPQTFCVRQMHAY